MSEPVSTESSSSSVGGRPVVSSQMLLEGHQEHDQGHEDSEPAHHEVELKDAYFKDVRVQAGKISSNLI